MTYPCAQSLAKRIELAKRTKLAVGEHPERDFVVVDILVGK